MQVWRPTLDFDEGSPVYGAGFLEYISVVTSTTDPVCTYGIFNNSFGPDLLGLSLASFARQDGGAADTEPCGMVWREPAPVAQDVRAGFRMWGSLDPSKMQFAGVLARVSGGTLVGDGTNLVRYEDVDAYGFYVVAYPGSTPVLNGYDVYLVKWLSGVRTVIASITQIPLLFFQANFALPFKLRLDVRDSGGNVELRAYIQNLFQNGNLILNQPVAWATGPVQYDTTSTITAAGRAGFMCAAERLNGGEATVVTCYDFTVYDTDTSTVERLDDWKRQQPRAAAYVVNAFNLDGYSLQQAFYHDQHGDTTAANLPGELVSDPGNNRLSVNAATAAETKSMWALSQRVAADLQSQHKSLVVNFDTIGTAPTLRQAGIVLRGSQIGASTADADRTGYAAFAEINAAGDLRVVIRRYVPGQAVLDIAEVDGVGLFTEGANFTFEFEVYQLAGPTLNGPVILEVQIGGTPVVVLANAVSGVSDDGAGIVTDASDDRVLSGSGEGMHLYHHEGTRAIFLDTWTQETVTTPGLPANDQASIVVAGEGTAVGDLSTVLEPTLPFEPVFTAGVVGTAFESGHFQAFPAVSTDRRQWRFAGVVEDPSALETFWDAHDGAETPFSFPLPSTAGEAAETVKAHFVPDSLRIDKLHKGGYAAEFQVEELFT